MVPQVECCSHNTAAIDSDAPTPGARNLGDQTVSTEAAKDSADFGALLFGVFPTFAQMGSGNQPSADIPIVESADAVVTVHDALE